VLALFSAAVLVFLHRDELKDQPVAPATSASSPSLSPEHATPSPLVTAEDDAGAAPMGSSATAERPKVIPKKPKPKPKASAAPKPPVPPPPTLHE